MSSVFLLWHTNPLPERDDEKLIGVYSSKNLAEKAQEKSEKLDGFKDVLEGFEIVEYDLDKDHWTEGFYTERWFEKDEKRIEFENLKITKISINFFHVGEANESADIRIEFEESYYIFIGPWRIFGKDFRLSESDHNQKYGLPQPINAYEEFKKVVYEGLLATMVYINRHTGDLNVVLENGKTLQCLNLTGNEDWELGTKEGEKFSNYHKFE